MVYTTNTEILDAVKQSSRITLILSLIFFFFAASISLLSLFLMTGAQDILWLSIGFLFGISGIGIVTMIIGIYEYKQSKKI